MLRKKNIVKNGKKAEGSERLVPGDKISIYFSDETYEKFRSTEKEAPAFCKSMPDIQILYEDADILIANKPAGMLSQKAAAKDNSLNDWFLSYLSPPWATCLCLRRGLR